MTQNSPWWKDDFSSDLYIEMQKLVLSQEVTDSEVEFVERVLKLEPSAQILDVPCGEGRHALALAAKGFQVTGVDITQSLVETGVKESQEQNLEVKLIQGDMRELPWENKFDAVLCLQGSFGYFDEGGNHKFVQAVAKALKPGGKFLVNPFFIEMLLREVVSNGWAKVEDIYVLQQSRFNFELSRYELESTFLRGSEEASQKSSIRTYTYKELCALLESVGLEVHEAFGNISGEPLNPSSFSQDFRTSYLLAIKK